MRCKYFTYYLIQLRLASLYSHINVNWIVTTIKVIDIDQNRDLNFPKNNHIQVHTRGGKFFFDELRSVCN